MPNSLDLPRGANLWTAQERDLYNRLPLFMAKVQVDFLKTWQVWPKLLSKQKWQANMGFTMQGVHKNPSPVLRSQFFPNQIRVAPKKDVIEIRESQEKVEIYRHNFESNLFHFLPSFVDFLTDSIDGTNKDITEKMMIANDLFLRTAIFHAAPKVYVCGRANGEIVEAPYWTSPTIIESKNVGWRQAIIAQCTETLSLAHIRKLGIVMYSDLGITPYSGSILPDGTDGAALRHKYCAVMGTEVWESFVDDPFLQDNRKLDLDIVTDGFQGSLFGRWTSRHERFEMRIAADGTIPAPEVIQEGADAYNKGEPEPNPDYVNAPFGVAFGCGGEAYKAIAVGPPPSDFQGQTAKSFASLDWNGKVGMTDNVLVPTLDAAGATVLDTNKRGEYLQLISDATMGILPVRRRNIVPIIYKRSRIGA